MKILFMCLGVFEDLSGSSVHIDVLKRLAEENEVWLACKNEGKKTTLSDEFGIHVLRIHTGTIKNVSLIKKGINTLLLEYQFKQSIKKHLPSVHFDLVLYTTPPITFANVIKYLKERDNAVTYLMLKDIFPQNAVDIGLLKTNSYHGLLYKHFKLKEKRLYQYSDYIGCMSPANIEYILKHNKDVSSEKLELCPNISIIEDKSVDCQQREIIRAAHAIPLNKKVFVYGGNLGKPQGIPFLMKCLDNNRNNDNVYFLIIGQGTEYDALDSFIKDKSIHNCRLMKSLPKTDYEKLVAACDVGMIFLDHRFTIPNFPSRLLSYMKCKIPVLAATDPNTDIGKIIVEGNFGWWCESNDSDKFTSLVKEIAVLPEEERIRMGTNGYSYMEKHYNPEVVYNTIMDKVMQ